jgi:arsenite methyltransferase
MNTIQNSQALKEIVKEKYGEIAGQQTVDAECCGSSCGCGTINSNLMSEDYSQLEGYVAEADLGLGCGIPTEYAQMKKGDIVVDLGSGAGNDAFVAQSVVGAEGRVIGVDMTPSMVERARANAAKLKYENVEFRLGDIEHMPIAADVADVVVSNCVLNLVPDKKKAFQETFRILKPGGHFSVSDIVLEGELPENIKEAAELYAGCISGAIQKSDYLKIIAEAGFTNIKLQKEKKIILPDEILKQYIADIDIEKLRDSGNSIISITVYAEKAVS